MMTLHLEQADLAGPWTLRDGAWRNRASRIAPFDHPAIEQFSMETDDDSFFIVRERLAGAGAAAEPIRTAGLTAAEIFDALLRWPLNFQVVRIQRSARRVEIHASARGSAPLFLTCRNGALEGDWDVARLYVRVPVELDFAAAAYALANLGIPYSRRTAYRHIHQLTERACASWDADRNRLHIRYPEALGWPRPRCLHDGADVHGAFAGLFAASLSRIAGASDEPVAFELSGGLDSGVATLIGAHRLGRERVRSFGLLLPGAQRESQRRRREAIARHCGIADVAIDAKAPLGRGHLSDIDPAIPWGDYYRESFLDLGQAIRGHDCRLLVRGIGGDEISQLNFDEVGEEELDCAASEEERQWPDYLTPAAADAAKAGPRQFDPAPNGAAPSSFHQAAAASTSAYLRRGIWPVYPYGDPAMVDLCRSLPAEWRRDRHLQRGFMRRAGLAEWVLRPDPPENFLPLRDMMFAGPSARFVAAMFEKPLLADLGLVDAGRLRARFDEACRDPSRPGRTELMEAATMESMLRTWHGAGEPLGP